MTKNILSTITAIVLGLNTALTNYGQKIELTEANTIIASHEMSLNERYSVASVNEVMKKNILLNLAYLDGKVSSKQDIVWDEITADQTYEFSLQPGETFAYHQDVLEQYKDSLKLTTNSIFGAGQGYLSDGYLYGDGVCHLASLINWTAKDAGLEVYVPKDHRSVGTINQVPDDYGVSIYIDPVAGIGENNNLYITNNKDKTVSFVFEIKGDDLVVSVSESA